MGQFGDAGSFASRVVRREVYNSKTASVSALGELAVETEVSFVYT